eukprot:g133.t1
MSFSSGYQNFDQYKDELKKRYNVSDTTNGTPNAPIANNKKHFEKAKAEFDIFTASISQELAGSVQSAFLYETTVAARITVNKYLNRRMRNDLKYCLDAWKSKVLQVSKSASLRSNTYAEKCVKEAKLTAPEEVKSEPRLKIDLNVAYISLENVYQKMSMDVYTRILSQGTKVFETLKMPEDILHSTLNLRNFYFNEMKSKADAEKHFAAMKMMCLKPSEPVTINMPLQMTTIARRFKRRLKCWLYDLYVAENSAIHPIEPFKGKESKAICMQFLNLYKRYTTTGIGDKTRRNFSINPLRYAKHPLNPNKTLLGHIVGNSGDDEQDISLSWLVRFLSRALNYTPTPAAYNDSQNDQFIKVLRVAVLIAFLVSNYSLGVEVEINKNIPGGDEEEGGNLSMDSDEADYAHKKEYKNTVVSKTEKDALKLMLKLYSTELSIMFLNGLDISKPAHTGAETISYDPYKKEEAFEKEFNTLKTRLADTNRNDDGDALETEIKHYQIIDAVSDILSTAIGYELHGSEFVPRLREASVTNTSMLLETDMRKRNANVLKLKKIMQTKQAELLQTTSNRGPGIHSKLKSELQQISEDISSELKKINNAMQRLTYMHKYLKQRKDEFSRQMWNPEVHFCVEYSNIWDAIEQDDPRPSFVAYDCMLLSDSQRFILVAGEDDVPAGGSVDVVECINSMLGDVKYNEDAVDCIISMNVWQRVTMRMVSELNATSRFRNMKRLEILDLWWEERHAVSKKLQTSLNFFESSNREKLDGYINDNAKKRREYLRKHKCDSDFMRWMKRILPLEKDGEYQGKVLEVSNINCSAVDRSDVLNFFQNEGTVLYLQMNVNESNAIICMGSSDEINKIMEEYDSKSKRRRFKLGEKLLILKRMDIRTEIKLLNTVGKDQKTYLNYRLDNHNIIMKALHDNIHVLKRERSYWVSKTAAKQLGMNEVRAGKFELDPSTFSLSELISNNEAKKDSLDDYTKTSDLFFTFGE